eukprot:7090331-Alexandrium_andersonii.AAC.1
MATSSGYALNGLASRFGRHVARAQQRAQWIHTARWLRPATRASGCSRAHCSTVSGWTCGAVLSW